MAITDLLKKASKGDRLAQRQLYEWLAPRGAMLCLRYVTNQEDIEDIVQNACLAFYKNLGSINPENDNQLYGYFKAAVFNHCKMHLRKRHLFPKSEDPEAELLAVPDPKLEKLEYAEVYHMVGQLPDAYRAVFNLFEIEGYLHKEIAELLGITESSSRSNLNRAKKILQKMLTNNESNNEKDNSKQS